MDPSSGRFITPDPIRDFYNPYSYVSNNPMNRIDPTGTDDMDTQENRSCTGYYYGEQRFNLLNMSHREYMLWIHQIYSQAELFWRQFVVGKEKTETAKSDDDATTDDKGPKTKMGPDWLQVSASFYHKGAGVEPAIIIMPSGKVYLQVYISIGVGSRATAEVKGFWFDEFEKKDNPYPDITAMPSKAEQIEDFQTNPQWGVNFGGAGINFLDITLGTPNNEFRKEQSAYGFGYMEGWSLNLYGNSYIPRIYLGQYDILKWDY